MSKDRSRSNDSEMVTEMPCDTRSDNLYAAAYGGQTNLCADNQGNIPLGGPADLYNPTFVNPENTPLGGPGDLYNPSLANPENIPLGGPGDLYNPSLVYPENTPLGVPGGFNNPNYENSGQATEATPASPAENYSTLLQNMSLSDFKQTYDGLSAADQKKVLDYFSDNPDKGMVAALNQIPEADVLNGLSASYLTDIVKHLDPTEIYQTEQQFAKKPTDLSATIKKTEFLSALMKFPDFKTAVLNANVPVPPPNPTTEMVY